MKIKYVDRTDVPEVFSDAIGAASFDGALLKLELCSTYPDGSSRADDRVLKRHPSGRVVMTASAAVELFNRLQKVMGALERSGSIKLKEKKPTSAVQ